MIEPVEKYDENEARDERGRWTDSGSADFRTEHPQVVGATMRRRVNNGERFPAASQAEEQRRVGWIHDHVTAYDKTTAAAHMKTEHSYLPFNVETARTSSAAAREHERDHADLMMRGPTPWDPWAESKVPLADDQMSLHLSQIKNLPDFHGEDGPYRVREATIGPNEVLYRGIGDPKELMDAAKAGSWRSRGTFTHAGPEGVLQMARSPKDVGSMPYRPFGAQARRLGYGDSPELWQTGYKHVVAIDASGLRVRGLVRPYGEFARPDIQAGLGAVKAISLNRILGIRDIGPKGAISKTDNTALMARFQRAAGIKKSLVTEMLDLVKYSDDEARDERGQWTSGAGTVDRAGIRTYADSIKQGSLKTLPAGYCDAVAEHVQRTYGYEHVSGDYRGPEEGPEPGFRHSWNRMADGTIVDGSADQFTANAADHPRVVPPGDPRQKWYKPESELAIEKFDPDEARDERGRWTSGGGADARNERLYANSVGHSDPKIAAGRAVAAEPEVVGAAIAHGQSVPGWVLPDGRIARVDVHGHYGAIRNAGMVGEYHERSEAAYAKYQQTAADHGLIRIATDNSGSLQAYAGQRMTDAQLQTFQRIEDAAGQKLGWQITLPGVDSRLRTSLSLGGGALDGASSLAAALAKTDTTSVRKYNEDELRDDHGRWSAGGDAPASDLAIRTFPHSLGIERQNMPQISRQVYPEFFAFVRGKGVGVHEETAKVSDLRPAQTQYYAAQAAQMPAELLRKPLIVSSDNYILDGTNRWARLLHDDPNGHVPVVRIGEQAHQALALMNTFPGVGHKALSLVGPTVQKMLDILKYSDDEARDDHGRWTSGGSPEEAAAAMVRTHGSKTVRQFLNTGDELHGGGRGASGYVMTNGSIAGSIGEHADLITDAGLEFPPARWQNNWPAVYHYENEVGVNVPNGLTLTPAQQATIGDLKMYADRMDRQFILEKRDIRKYSPDQAREPAGSPEGGEFAVTVGGEGALSWGSQAGQHPEKGPPGISYRQEHVDAPGWSGKAAPQKAINILTSRDESGKLTGILYHYPQAIPPYEKKNNINLMVHPQYRRQGIGTQLLAEADKRKWLYPMKQGYTAGGSALMQHYLAHVAKADIEKYDETEARDEQGRWTDGGGGAPSHNEWNAESHIEPADGAAQDAWADEMRMPIDQQNALSRYADMGYKYVNDTLRGRGIDRSYEKTFKSEVKSLDAALATAPPLVHPVTAYRYVSSDVTDHIKVGGTFTDKGYMSVSLSPAWVKMAAQEHSTNDLHEGSLNLRTIVRVTIPAGQRAAFPSNSPWLGFRTEERELLLPRNTTLRWTSYIPPSVHHEKPDTGRAPTMRFGSATAEVVPTIKKYSDDEPRDEKGQWTSGGGSASNATLGERIGREGGFTYRVPNGRFPKTGYSVGVYEDRTRDMPLPPTPEARAAAVRQYRADHADVLRLPEHHLGAWVDGGRLYFDIVLVKSSEADAKALAVEHHQDAYYDLAKKETIRVAGKVERAEEASAAAPAGGREPAGGTDVPGRVGADGQGPATLLAKYSDDEPRDDHGRWTSDGGGSVAGDAKPRDLRVAAKEVAPTDRALKATQLTWANELPYDQRRALGRYTETGYYPINVYLRDREWPRDVTPDMQAASIAKASVDIPLIDAALNAAPPLPYPINTYRFVSEGDVTKNWKVGQTFTDKGYVSTSISKPWVDERMFGLVEAEAHASHGTQVGTGPGLSIDWTKPEPNPRVLVDIRVPAGAKGGYMPAAGPSVTSYDEREFLLPRGSTFKVLSYTAPTGVPGHDGYRPGEAVLDLLVPVAKYDENEARDEKGQWTSGGGGDGGSNPSAMADWGANAAAWSLDQRVAIERYQAGGYGPINRTLRGQPVTEDDAKMLSDHGPEPVTSYIDRIDAAIAAAPPLPREATVYRHVYYDRQERGAGDRRFYAALGSPGRAVLDRGYTSTTVERYKAEANVAGLVHFGLPTARLLEIHVPAGTRGLYVGNHGNPAFALESEFILPRGGTFTVRSVHGPTSVLDYTPAPTLTAP